MATPYAGALRTGLSGAQFSVHITENIILLNEKKSNASIVITVPPGAVAELYRRFFGAPAGLPLGSQIPIPEESPTGETRQQFLDSITNQQLTGLGLEVDLHESFLVPRTTGGEFEVVMRGPATFARDYSTDRAGSGFVRHVAVGFHGMNATSNAELLFETLTFGQMMLQSLQGSHVFTSTWETSIHFPSEAVLLNPDELSRLNWKVEFGPDMSSTAKVTAGKKSTVDVEETTTIGDGDITANPQVLMSELSGYKQFELVIQFPAAGTSPDGAIVPDSSQPAQEPTPMVGDDDPDLSFSKDFRNISHPKFDVPLIDASDTDPATGITSKLSATVIVDALLDLGLHLDLKASVSFLDGFQATAFSAYFSMKMNATVSFHQTLVGVGWKKDLAEYTLFSDKSLYHWGFAIGFIPVWIDFVLGAGAKLTLNTNGALNIDFSWKIQSEMKEGFQWIRGSGFSGISEDTTTTTRKGPTISAQLGLSLIGELPIKFKALLYSLVGPQVVVYPYARIDASVSGSVTNGSPSESANWDAILGIKIKICVGINSNVAGTWLGKKILGFLNDGLCSKTTLYQLDKQLVKWTGSYVLGAPPFALSTNSVLSSHQFSPGENIQVPGEVTGTDGSGVNGAEIDAIVTSDGPAWECIPNGTTDPEEGCTLSNAGLGIDNCFTTSPNCTGPFPLSGGWDCLPTFRSPGHPYCDIVQGFFVTIETTTTDFTGTFNLNLVAPYYIGDFSIELSASHGAFTAGPEYLFFSSRTPDITPPLVDPIVVLFDQNVTLSQPASILSQGWYSGNVTVLWQPSDPESYVQSTSDCESVGLVNDTLGTTLTCTATDSSGLSNSTSVTVRIDNSPPIINPVVTSTEPVYNNSGWYRGNVTVDWEISDPQSGIGSTQQCFVEFMNLGPQCVSSAEPCSPTTFTGETSLLLVFLLCTAVNKAGVASSALVSVRIDKTPPVITGSRTPSPNPDGWNNQDVTVAFTCGDALSGVAMVTAGALNNLPVTLSSEGSGQSVMGQCIDNAGNIAETTIGNINIDKTPPTITGFRSLPANMFGWTNDNVMVHFDCTDGLSGLSFGSQPADTLVSTEGAGQFILGTCTDLAGNSASSVVGPISIDKTAPSLNVTADRVPDYNGWYNHTVTVSVSGIDALSGIVSCDPSIAYSGPDSAMTLIRRSCTDKAGNTRTDSVVLRYDSIPPSIQSDDEGKSFILRQAVLASFRCLDNLSGIVSCGQGGQTAFLVNTSTVGDHSFTITARDNAGNVATKMVHYRVVYNFIGLPLPHGGNSSLTGVIAVKFVLTDASSNPVPGAVAQIWVDCAPAPVSNCAAPNLGKGPNCFTGTNCSNYFKYDTTGNQYIFQLSPRRMALAKGVHTIYITLDDATYYSMRIVLS